MAMVIERVGAIENNEDGGLGSLLLVRGISRLQIQELIHYANTDEEIHKFTSDKRRFADENTFNKWKKKGRIIYTLTKSADDLLGIIWLGQKKFPGMEIPGNIDPTTYELTFAIRIYGKARGKRLGRKFMQETLKSHKSFSEIENKNPTGIWLETSADNIPAVTLYERVGFIAISDPDEQNKILMIYDL